MIIGNSIEQRLMVHDSDSRTGRGTVRLGAAQPLDLSPRGKTITQRGAPLNVPAPTLPLWYERGWRKEADGKSYRGEFRVAGQRWHGLVEVPYPGGYRVAIWRPPLDKIRAQTDHGPCFSRKGEEGQYGIHFRHTPASLDQAITSVERVLAEALD